MGEHGRYRLNFGSVKAHGKLAAGAWSSLASYHTASGIYNELSTISR